MRKSNYDKFPFTAVSGKVTKGWENIIAELEAQFANESIWTVELYVGTHESEIISAFSKTGRTVIDTRDLFLPESDIYALTQRFMTDDVLFGYMANVRIEEYFDTSKLALAKDRIADGGKYIVIGTGASLVTTTSPVIYFDMARWEIQQRFRRHEVKAIGFDNSADGPSLQYKRGYFLDWNICDAIKLEAVKAKRVTHWVDTNAAEPKMITHCQFMEGIDKTARKPFRVVPFFDPAPWGGQWMKEVCDLDRSVQNYGWCFDCVPEENSLLLKVDDTLFESPSQDVVIFRTRELLGTRVEARFGRSFPIRFDFLDTMGGGNLSLQVHPTNEFFIKNFGMPYTQDESYYLLDAGEDAVVYLGLKTGINPDEMLADLRAAQRGEIVFDAEKYVNKLPAKKHDHYLIPSGTIHCSGHDSMVLEISSTPSIFTFKLWDWQRLGLDGKPRPINVERGSHVIQWDRNTEFVNREIRNHFEVLSREDGIMEERTGLHPNEFIETRRHTFTKPVAHNTNGGVNVFNLVDGSEAIIESPTGAFDSFVVHYAETFIIPACVGEYTIRPYGTSEGQEVMTLKAYVR